MRPGAAILGIAAAFVAAGAAFGSPSLYVPGVALALLDLGLRAWTRWVARRLVVEGIPGPWTVIEGEPYPIGVRVTGRVPVPGSRLEHPLARDALATGTRPAGEHLMTIRPERRGRRLLAPPTLVIGDPFGLHQRRIEAGEAVPVIVLPRVEPVSAATDAGAGADELVGARARGASGTGVDARGIDFEIDGVRPFREGTPASRIHWPTVARSGELVERRLISGGDSPPLVVLDAFDPAGEDALDRAVRAAASLCAHLAKGPGCSLVLPGTPVAMRVDSSLRGWPSAHAGLALVERSKWPAAIPPVAAGGTVFLVSASRNPRRPALGSSVRLLSVTPEAG